jgi:hypothetical protein
MIIKNPIYIVIALSIFLLSIILGINFWYDGEWKDGIGFFPVGIIICGWAIALVVLIWGKLIKFKVPIVPIVVLISVIVIIDSIMDSIKNDQIENNKSKTKAEVLFVGTKYRHGFGISYSYQVNNVRYEKWDDNADFIHGNKLKMGDSINIVFSRKNPHIHEFEKLIDKNKK